MPNRPKTSEPLVEASFAAAVRAAERAHRTEIPSNCVVAERVVPSARGELRLRWFRPRERSELGTPPEETPGLVFFHGGGFVAGDAASHDALCGGLSAASGCSVVSCSYRLAPEHRFPAALDDAYFAACFVHEHADEFGIDHRRIGIAGIEVGASLATGVARLAKERRNPALAFQLLVEPVLDFSPAALSGAGEIRAVPLEWAVAQYVDANLREDARCSPQRATNLIGLPSTFMLTGSEAITKTHATRYATRLREAHVPVTILDASDASACATALAQALA